MILLGRHYYIIFKSKFWLTKGCFDSSNFTLSTDMGTRGFFCTIHSLTTKCTILITLYIERFCLCSLPLFPLSLSLWDERHMHKLMHVCFHFQQRLAKLSFSWLSTFKSSGKRIYSHNLNGSPHKGTTFLKVKQTV